MERMAFPVWEKGGEAFPPPSPTQGQGGGWRRAGFSAPNHPKRNSSRGNPTLLCIWLLRGLPGRLGLFWGMWVLESLTLSTLPPNTPAGKLDQRELKIVVLGWESRAEGVHFPGRIYQGLLINSS